MDVKEDQEPLLARKIPPKIAEAVAGMELLGVDLVDRQGIIEAIDALRGSSFSERLAQELTESISKGALASMTKVFEASVTIATAEARKSAQALANTLVEKNALASLTKAFEATGAVAAAAMKSAQALANTLVEKNALASLTKAFEASGAVAAAAMKSSHTLANALINRNALIDMTKAFETSGFKAVEEAARNSQAMMENTVDTSALTWMTKAFETSGFKAVEEAARNSQAMMDSLTTISVLKTFKFESEMLDRLVRQMNETGWLVPTDTRGMWEFAPGSRAGSFKSSNTFMPLKAALAKRPDLQVAVTMESAAFIHQLSEHSPRKGAIAVPSGASRKGSLSRFRHVNIQLPEFATTKIDGIPVHTISGLLVAMAIRPMSYRDWPNVRKWLPIACNKISTSANEESGALGGERGLLRILQDQPTTVIARVAYFFKIAGHEATARKILALIDKPYDGPIYLGPRDSVKAYATYDSLTKVYDNLIELK